jgi:hypothetical protein
MSTMKLELNGTLITGRIDGVENFSLTLRNQDEDGSLAKSFSSELTFYDDGYQIIKQILVDDPIGYSNEVQVKVYDSCCRDAVFVGLIKGDAIDWCEPGCWVSANLVEDTSVVNCIRSTLIWDNHNGFLSRNHPIIRYCIEMKPEFIQYVLYYLLFMINIQFQLIILPFIPAIFLLISSVYLICLLVRIICAGISLSFRILGRTITIRIGPFCNPPNCNTSFTNPVTAINFMLDVIRDANRQIIACGRFHPSPFIRDYVKNVCDKCGLVFQSSILNDPSSPYYNAVMFAAQIKKGRKKDSTDYTLINDNKPVETLETLLNDYIKPTFNAEFRIVNGILVVERKDFFLTLNQWIDTEQLLNDGKIVDDQVCYNWTEQERWAFGRYQYAPDAQDYMGNEALVPRYNEIVDWNVPYSPSQSGEREVILQLGAARHRQDGIDTDIYTFFQNALGGVINAVFAGAFSFYNRALLINQHTAFNYKFLILNPSSDGEVNHYYDNTFCGGDPGAATDERFNYPFWFVPGFKNNLYGIPNNGVGFHWIDDPRLPGVTKWDFKFTFIFDCENYNDFNFAKYVRLIRGGQVINGIVREVQIDFVRRTCQVTGIL